MEIEALINQFGYLAIFLGTVIEGESVLLLGGFFAAKDYLSFPAVIVCGAVGTYCSEAALYHLGLSKGPALMQRSPERLARYERFALRLHEHRYLLILGYRFFYGMRTIAPLAIGASGIRPGLFHSLNLIGTIVWTLVITSLGFFFGRAIGRFLEQYNGYGIVIPVVLLIAVLLIRYALRARKSTVGTVNGIDNKKVASTGGIHE